jgi:hypothetical protein
MRNAHKILVGKPEGKRHLQRYRHRQEGNIRMDLREIGSGRCELDASGLRQGPAMDSCEHSSESLCSIKGRDFLDCLSEY